MVKLNMKNKGRRPKSQIEIAEELLQFFLSEFHAIEQISFDSPYLQQILDKANQFGFNFENNSIELLITRRETSLLPWHILETDRFFENLYEHLNSIVKCRDQTEIASLGQVFTPIPIIDEIIDTVIRPILPDPQNFWAKPTDSANFLQKFLQKHPIILDFACGTGGFILRWLDKMLNMVLSIREDHFEWNLLQLSNALFAIDLDPIACWSTYLATHLIVCYYYSIHKNKKKNQSTSPISLLREHFPITIYQGDFLECRELNHLNPQIILGNPPYVFSRNLPVNTKRKYQTGSYCTATNQFDLSDLFLEHAVQILSPGGSLGVIIPEPILNLENREPIRKLFGETLDQLEIRKVSGIFDGKAVENILFFGQKSNASEKPQNHSIIRIKPPQRDAVEILREEGKKLLQKSLLIENNQEKPIIHWIKDHFLSIDQWNALNPSDFIMVFRGIELGKEGRVMQCPSCGKWMPYSAKRTTCIHCELKLPPSIPYATLLHNSTEIKIPKFYPFLRTFTGNTLNVIPDTVIDCTLPGINYKVIEFYQTPRILIRQLLNRKRLCIAVAPANLLTSQSIYNLILPERLQSYLKEFATWLAADHVSYYNYWTFSQGKRLFSRILLGKIRELPWIPRLFHETPTNDLNAIKQSLPEMPPEFQQQIHEFFSL
jgi:hypothetical protein